VNDVYLGDAVRDLVTAVGPGGCWSAGFLEALDAVRADAVDGRGRLVLVPGHAGIGETATERVVVRAWWILDRLGPEAEAEPYALSLAGARLAQDR
jgi:hypothetical protein